MSSTERNKQIARAYFEAISRGDTDATIAAYAPQGVMVTTGNTLGSGTFNLDQVCAAASGAFQAFPKGLKFTIRTLTAEDNRVAVEAESNAEHVSGVYYNNHYHFLLSFDDQGRILELKEYMDTELVTKVVFGGKSHLTEHDL